ncbi:MAG TPA: hypothetical protein VGQ83_00675 [Polyangia bacterium]|jgi:hypothetical protein
MTYPLPGPVRRGLGYLLAPLAAAGSAVRHARVFHPDGVVFFATVEPLAAAGPVGALAARLEGRALVRLSNAWWRTGREWPDVLGVAVRFLGESPPTPGPKRGDQDLLFATIRRPVTTVAAALSTDPHDFLANDYYAVSPFDVDGIGRAKLRLVPTHPGVPGRTRRQRLENAVERGLAVFLLEVRPRGGGWTRVCAVRLFEELAEGQASLRFWPFQSDRGLAPRGLVNALRWATYRASQQARGARSDPPLV